MLSVFNKYYNYFFLIVILFYNFFPKRVRPIILLIVSVLFFYFISSKLIIYLILTIISVYLSGIILNKINDKEDILLESCSKEDKKEIKKKYKRKKKLVLFGCIVFNVVFLFIFKYLKFFTINTNYILELFNINYQFEFIKLIAPIGISFYTLQALSYIIDVYNKKIEADKNLFRVALFISFFPQIVEGPIARYENTAVKLYEGNKITYDNLCLGLQRILWGLFKKMVIADRLNILVKTIFNGYSTYSGFICFIGALGYTIMLYMEFSSTMDVVIGTGQIFSVKIPENFKQPFFSKSIQEFWTRWHISLGAWFKDYIYYPISLSKPLKKITIKARKILGNHFGALFSGTIALLVVWLLNGLWHGAGWTYILFGLYHFILISFGNIFEPVINKICKKNNINRDNCFIKSLRIIKVAFLVIIGELIFRAPTVYVAKIMIKKIFTDFSFKITELSTLGIDFLDFLVLVIALIIVFIISYLKEKNIEIREVISKYNIAIRWTIYFLLIFSIIIFGAYGPGYQPVDPIYADF